VAGQWHHLAVSVGDGRLALYVDGVEFLKPGDVHEVARAAMIEAHRDYPVPKNMRLVEAEALLQRCLA